MTIPPTYRRVRDRLLTEAFNAVLRAMALAAQLRRKLAQRIAEARGA